MQATKHVEDTGWFSDIVQISVDVLHLFIQQIGSLGQDGVAVDIVDAGEKEVIRVDEIVRNGGEIGFHADKEAPAEVKHVSRSARRFPNI